MAEQDDPPSRIAAARVARIVSSYVGHHRIGGDELAGLIAEVHRALAALERDTAPAQVPLKPAVPIRRSIARDYVVCLECGFRAQMLRRHLRTAHGLEVADYRARWKLPVNHPLVAPGYSEWRSTMAREFGLGRRRGANLRPPASEQVPAAEQRASAGAAPQPVTRRGGRRPRQTPAT